MQSDTPISLSERLRGTLTRRGVAVVLALAIELVVVLVFLSLSGGPLKPRPRERLAVFQVEKEREKAAPPIEIAKEESKRQDGGGSKPITRSSEVETPIPPETPEAKTPSNVLWLSRRDYRSADITGRKGTADGPGQGMGTSAASDSALADGKGPHGEKVYIAEWYREPTFRELNPYVPERARGRSGWGVIVCRTVANYRVEDCAEVDDSPRGSGYAGAVRQAAFQFRVRPSRIGGRPQIGTLVYIRIRYSVTVVQGDSARPGPQSDPETPDDQ
ncbi:MAG: hypothetical protein V4574_04490 [Pseudomonadota bacterium]